MIRDATVVVVDDDPGRKMHVRNELELARLLKDHPL